MPGENPPPELKVNLWMPFDIGPFLQDTAHLSAEEIGAYTLLLLYYWAHGPLPNDPKRLANIAKMSLDTWSITFVSLSMFFFEGSDGLLHQKGADRRRAVWIDKRLKAREKAIKAITKRWDEYRAKKAALAASSHTPSIPQVVREEILERYPTSEVQEQKQKQKPPPPTPSAGAAGDAGRADTPSIPAEVIEAGRELAAGIIRRTQQIVGSAHKAKPSEMAALARPNGQVDVSGRSQGETRAARTPGAAARASNLQSEPQKADTREDWLKSEVLAYWAGQNPDGPELHFTPADDRAFRALLRAHPELNLPLFKKLLLYRSRSEVNPAALPHKWVRSIFEYAAGPLGKFGKPLSRSQLI